MTTVHSFYSAKGGQGVTVTAAAFALSLTGRVLIDDRAGDMTAVLGIPDQTWPMTVRDGLDLAPVGHDTANYDNYDHVIVDHGVNPPPETVTGRRILVTRACYLALRRAVHTLPHDIRYPDAVVLIDEPGRTLTASDVAAVIGIEPIIVPYDLAFTRTVDAGLLTSRRPLAITDALHHLEV
jgi:hypothetical protein